MPNWFKWFKYSKIAAVAAQIGVVAGGLDLSHVTALLPAKVAAIVTVVSGLIAGWNKAIGTNHGPPAPPS